MSGPMRRRAADPAEAIAPGADQAGVDPGVWHQEAVPGPQILGTEFTGVAESSVDGAEVAGDPAGGAAYGAVRSGHGDFGSGRMDLLDPARGDALRPQEQVGRYLKPGVQAVIDGCKRTFGQCGGPDRRGRRWVTLVEAGWHERVDGPPPP